MLQTRPSMRHSRIEKKVAKIARVALPVYAVVVTGLVALAVTVGPFREPAHFLVTKGLLEANLKNSEREQKKLETERDRLLEAMKKLQTDWRAGQETIRALRELSRDPAMEQRIVEANRTIEKLLQERAVLIATLNEIQKELQAYKQK